MLPPTSSEVRGEFGRPNAATDAATDAVLRQLRSRRSNATPPPADAARTVSPRCAPRSSDPAHLPDHPPGGHSSASAPCARSRTHRVTRSHVTPFLLTTGVHLENEGQRGSLPSFGREEPRGAESSRVGSDLPSTLAAPLQGRGWSLLIR